MINNAAHSNHHWCLASRPEQSGAHEGLNCKHGGEEDAWKKDTKKIQHKERGPSIFWYLPLPVKMKPIGHYGQAEQEFLAPPTH